MKTKKVNPSTRAEKPAKKVLPPLKTYREEYFEDLFSFGRIPVSQEYLSKFAHDWVERARLDENMLTMYAFAAQKGVPQKMMDDWIRRSTDLARAKEIVRTIVGDRRETGAMRKKLDPSSVFRNQHVYCDYDKAGEEWRAELKSKQAKDGASTGPITVVMPKFKIDTKGNAVEDKDEE